MISINDGDVHTNGGGDDIVDHDNDDDDFVDLIRINDGDVATNGGGDDDEMTIAMMMLFIEREDESENSITIWSAFNSPYPKHDQVAIASL